MRSLQLPSSAGDKWGLQFSLGWHGPTPGVGLLLVKEGVCFSEVYKSIVWPEPCNSMWSMGQQHWHPWELVRNAGPQAPPQTSGIRTHAPKRSPGVLIQTLLFEK